MKKFRYLFLIFILLSAYAYLNNKSLNVIMDRVNRAIDEIIIAEIYMWYKNDFTYWDLDNETNRESFAEYVKIPAVSANDLTTSTILADSLDFKKWNRSHQNGNSLRFSKLKEINKSNIKSLSLAWEYHSNDSDNQNLGASVSIQANPIVSNGVIYTPTIGNYVVAIDAKNGREIWRYKALSKRPAQRGLVWHEHDGKQSIFFTSGKYIVKLDAKNGEPDKEFGENGVIKSDFMSKVTPIIFGNQVIVLNFKPGIESFDMNSGNLIWNYSLNPPIAFDRVGGKKRIQSRGNPWSGVSIDKERGIIYFSRGNPDPPWTGIQRPGDNTYSNSVVAFDINKKNILWEFQEVRHDLWDLDIAAYPMLTSITVNGREVDVVVTPTKLGNTLILDRLSGRPVFDFRLKRSKSSNIRGEKTSLYQPSVEIPQPFSKQEFKRSDVTNIGIENNSSVIKQLNNSVFGWFQPHFFEKNSNTSKDLVLFGLHGGASWPGASIDPFNKILYITSNDLPWKVRIKRSGISDKLDIKDIRSINGYRIYKEKCANCHAEDLGGAVNNEDIMAPAIHGIFDKYTKEKISDIINNGLESMPAVEGVLKSEIAVIIEYMHAVSKLRKESFQSYISKPWKYHYFQDYFKRLEDFEGFPGSKPPWGKLTAINLNNGLILWSVPLGEYDELKERGVPITGTENYGGATSTVAGLIFAGGTLDKKIRAFDSSNGSELWQYELPYVNTSPITTYEIDGKQYILVTSSGGGVLFDADPDRAKHGDAILSFSLPKDTY